jgi:hypothetical protein
VENDLSIQSSGEKMRGRNALDRTYVFMYGLIRRGFMMTTIQAAEARAKLVPWLDLAAESHDPIQGSGMSSNNSV